MSNPRHPSDPSLPTATLPPDYTNNALSLLNQYGPKRPTDHTELRKLVLDYLCHQCFVDTAAAFARESPVSVPEKSNSQEVVSGKPRNSFTPIHLPVVVKDHVIERTVRFDTDEDGDAEMGDLTPSGSKVGSGETRKTDVTDIKRPGIDLPLKGLNGKNGEVEEDEAMNDAASSAGTSGPESYPDWTVHDIHTTQLRLVIKEHIISGRLKEAIGLINIHFPAVLGPSTLSKLHTTTLAPSASLASAATSSPLKSFKSQRQKPTRLSYAPNRPLGGPTQNSQPSFSFQPNSNARPQASSWSSNLKGPEPDVLSTGNLAYRAEDFPHAMFSSLHPAHVALNLQIQYFVELVRTSSSASLASATTTLDPDHPTNGTHPDASTGVDQPSATNRTTNGHVAPTLPNIELSTSTSALSDDTSSTSSAISSRTQSVALSLPHIRSLYCYVQTLPKPNERPIFHKELQSVSGLLAYSDPWNSPVKRYLDQSRRVMLAEIVNAAILVHIGRSPTPILKMVAQQSTFTWSTLNEMGERINCAKPDDKTRTRPCNFFNLSEFVASHDVCES